MRELRAAGGMSRSAARAIRGGQEQERTDEREADGGHHRVHRHGVGLERPDDGVPARALPLLVRRGEQVPDHRVRLDAVDEDRERDEPLLLEAVHLRRETEIQGARRGSGIAMRVRFLDGGTRAGADAEARNNARAETKKQCATGARQLVEVGLARDDVLAVQQHSDHGGARRRRLGGAVPREVVRRGGEVRELEGFAVRVVAPLVRGGDELGQGGGLAAEGGGAEVLVGEDAEGGLDVPGAALQRRGRRNDDVTPLLCAGAAV